jgi:class 3 adenylate cyclase
MYANDSGLLRPIQHEANHHRAFLRRISEVCEGHHGHVVKTLGDGVLAVFQEGSKSLKR